MRIDNLRTFIEVVKRGSMLSASKALGLTQPAVSTHIQNIESSLKIKLFERTPKGLVLTPEGEILYREALDLLGRYTVASLMVPESGATRVRIFMETDIFEPAVLRLLGEGEPLEVVESLEEADIVLKETYKPADEALEFVLIGNLSSSRAIVYPSVKVLSASALKGFSVFRVASIAQALALVKAGKAIAPLPKYLTALEGLEALSENPVGWTHIKVEVRDHRAEQAAKRLEEILFSARMS